MQNTISKQVMNSFHFQNNQTQSTVHGPASVSNASSIRRVPGNAKMVGNYLLGRSIGQGTFGKVHLGMHIPTNERVAVKLIDKKTMRPKDMERVKNEIAILMSIRHRNIMHLYEIIETEKTLLLVTEHLEKGELFQQILKHKKIPEEQACRYFQQIIAAVHYLHSNKIAHRDLKPENVLIDHDGQVKIIDFGLSKHYSKHKELKSYCGSPCYAAPEIIEGKNSYNPLLTDLWSCGIILFAMLCGYLPFCDADTHTLYKKVMACNYKLPTHLSGAARHLIESLLVKNPSERMSLENIQNHEWFNIVQPQVAFGVGKGEYLKVDYGLLQKMQQMNIAVEGLVQQLASQSISKGTATYFIMMKKMSKTQFPSPAYIGSDSFDPCYIVKPSVKEQASETELPVQQLQSVDAPSSTQNQIGLEAGEVPQMWIIDGVHAEVQTNITQEDLFKIYPKLLHVVQTQEGKSEQILKQTMVAVSHLLIQNQKQSRLEQFNTESQFYSFNPKHRKSATNLQQLQKIKLAVADQPLSDHFKVRQLRANSYQKEHRVRTIPRKPRQKSNTLKMKDQKGINKQKKQTSEFKKTEEVMHMINLFEGKKLKKLLPYFSFLKDTKVRQKLFQIKRKGRSSHERDTK